MKGECNKAKCYVVIIKDGMKIQTGRICDYPVTEAIRLKS